MESKDINLYNLHFSAKLKPWKLRWTELHADSTGSLEIHTEFWLGTSCKSIQLEKNEKVMGGYLSEKPYEEVLRRRGEWNWLVIISKEWT
jgi:hypothetical protein